MQNQTLVVPMLKCVNRERNSFLEMSAAFDLNHDELAGRAEGSQHCVRSRFKSGPSSRPNLNQSMRPLSLAYCNSMIVLPS